MRLKLTFWFLVVFASVAVAQQSGFRVDGVGGVSVAGSNTQVQFNDGGALGADSGFTFSKAAQTFRVSNFKDPNEASFDLGASGIKLPSTGVYAFTSGANTWNSLDTGIARNAAGVIEVNNGTAGTYRDLKVRQAQTTAVAVASLQACNAGAKGTRSFVTDANATTFLSTVAGGGANNVPVVCNGTNWVIG